MNTLSSKVRFIDQIDFDKFKLAFMNENLPFIP